MIERFLGRASSIMGARTGTAIDRVERDCDGNTR
jgi:hypothetical protein